jgi:hypothetical protein
MNYSSSLHISCFLDSATVEHTGTPDFTGEVSGSPVRVRAYKKKKLTEEISNFFQAITYWVLYTEECVRLTLCYSLF